MAGRAAVSQDHLWAPIPLLGNLCTRGVVRAAPPGPRRSLTPQRTPAYTPWAVAGECYPAGLAHNLVGRCNSAIGRCAICQVCTEACADRRARTRRIEAAGGVATIPPPWGLLTLGLLALLPGDALYRLVFPPLYPVTYGAPDLGERLFLRLLGGMLLVGWWALLLAELGLFGPGTVLLGVALLSAVLYWLAGRADRRRLIVALPRRLRRPGAHGLALGGLVLLAGVLFFARPFETIVGAEDAGIYFNGGGAIARHGAILVEDPGLASFGDAAANAAAGGAARHLLLPLPGGRERFLFVDWQRLAGFFLLPDRPNTVTPQFLHLFPTWLALWATLGGGIGAMVYGGPSCALLGVVATYYLARRLFGPAAGLLAGLFLTLNGLQLWFARESLSEPLLQCLLVGALYAYVLAVEAGAGGDKPTLRGGLLLSGLALGSVALAHAQFLFALLPVAALVASLRLGRGWRREHRWFFLPLALLLVHATVHIARYALGYFEGIYHHVWRNAWRDRGQTALLVLIPLALLVLLDRTRPWWLPFVRDRRIRRASRWALAAVTVAGAAYLYLLRPGLLSADALQGYFGAPVPPGPAGNLVRLGWYLSPLGIALLVAGLATLLLCDLDERTAAPLVAVAPFVALYVTGTYTQEGYIYSLRRFVPLIVPVASLLIAYATLRAGPAMASALRRPRLAGPLRALGLAAAGLLVLFFAYTNAPLVRHREYAGLLDQVAALAGRFGPDDLILFSGPRDETPKLATPLHQLFGRESWIISTNLPNGPALDDWLSRQAAAGRRVHVLMSADGGKLLLPRHRLEPVARLDATLRQYETLAAQKPHNVQENELRYSLYAPRPLGPGESVLGPLPYRIEAGAFDEAAQVVGFHNVEQAAPGGQEYRWTDGNAELRIPWPAQSAQPATGRPLTLRLTLSGGPRPAATRPRDNCGTGGEMRPVELGPAQVVVSLKPEAGSRQAHPLATLTLGQDFDTYAIELPADALVPTPDGMAIIALTVAAPPGCPGSAWRPVDYPGDLGATYDERTLHVRFARAELVAAP